MLIQIDSYLYLYVLYFKLMILIYIQKIPRQFIKKSFFSIKIFQNFNQTIKIDLQSKQRLMSYHLNFPIKFLKTLVKIFILLCKMIN